MSDQFYVYLHRRATDGRVFYVGKGKSNRAHKQSKRNHHWRNVAAKHGLEVEILFDGLSEAEAFEEERNVIAELRYFGEPLTNRSKGGEGPYGYKHTHESRATISESSPRMWSNKEFRRKIIASQKAAQSSPEARERVSKRFSGKKKSYSQRAKMSEANRRRWLPGGDLASRRKPVICSNGMVFSCASDAVKWLKENVEPKASNSNIYICCNGKRKTAYGFTWQYMEKRK